MAVSRQSLFRVAIAFSAVTVAGAGAPASEQVRAAKALIDHSTASSTLDGVRRKGFVQCGVSTGIAGFSAPDKQGQWRGLDVDVCRAIAAAGLGDATKVRFTPLTAAQ